MFKLKTLLILFSIDSSFAIKCFTLSDSDKFYTYKEYSDEKETGEIQNSTTKSLWKRMHGIK